VLVLAAAIAWPSLHHSTHGHNETSAIAWLRGVHSAQSQFIASHGKAGLFGELSGGFFVRGTEQHLDPPLISSAWRYVSRDGIVERSGYCFRILLPGENGTFVHESAPQDQPVREPDRPAHPCRGRIAVPHCETRTSGPVTSKKIWVCVAWPKHYIDSGRRAFYIDQDGDILWIDDPQFRGVVPPELTDWRPSG